VEIRSSPTASFKSKEMKTEQWIFPDETLDIRFDKLLNTAGGFFDKGIDPAYMAMNTTSYARVIVKYEWNEKDYSTTRDFSAPFNKVYVVENIGLISSEGFKEIVFDNLNQVFDEPAPIDQAMYNDYLRIMKS
jgi:hypothetical protein